MREREDLTEAGDIMSQTEAVQLVQDLHHILQVLDSSKQAAISTLHFLQRPGFLNIM